MDAPPEKYKPDHQPEQPLIAFEAISKGFPGVQALTNVSFEVYAGEVHALMGENGAGKSTLMKILAGAHAPDSGTLRLGGQPVQMTDPVQAARLGISMIYQELTVLDNLNVGRNIMLGVEPLRPGGLVNWRALYGRAEQVIHELGLTLNVHTPLADLPIAARQMVEIARAAQRDPRIIVMDEPTSSLGKQEEETLFALIERLKARGVAILYISHRMDEVFRLADRITVLRDGLHIETAPATAFTRERLIEKMVGRRIEVLNRKTATRGAVVLEVDHLALARRLQDISFALCAGEIVGLAGLIGAGQTELAQVLFGLERATAGEIRLHGRAVAFRSPRDAIRAGIAYVPEDRKGFGLVLPMSVQANMSLASLSRLAPRGILNFRQMGAMMGRWRERLNIRAASPRQSIENLSGGNQQKVILARWLNVEPRVLILNDPTRGVDVGAKTEVHHLIREIAAGGVAVLMISSELPEILTVSDRILVMREGTISGELLAHDATEQGVMALAFPDTAANMLSIPQEVTL